MSTKAMARHKNTEVPDDINVETLNDYQMSLLRDLKRRLYEQKLKARRERKRAEKAEARAELAARAPVQLWLGV
jgi:hypothetical protein